MSTRRVVTGHTTGGASAFASDDLLEPRTSPGLPGVEMQYLWGSEEPQRYPDDGTMPDWRMHFPPRGGSRFVIFSLPPADQPVWEDADGPEARAHADEQFPGLLDTFHPEDAGMHTSDTTDYAIVLDGEVVLELDDGAERTLRAGDVVVQNGTRHRWTNRTTQRVSVAFVLLGAERVG